MPTFYKQIFSYWFEIFRINPVTHNEVLNDYIQNNKFILIDDKPISGHRWSQAGINIICDILDKHGHFLSKPQLEQKYQTTIDQI